MNCPNCEVTPPANRTACPLCHGAEYLLAGSYQPRGYVYGGGLHPPDLVVSVVDQRYTNPHIVPLTSDEEADV